MTDRRAVIAIIGSALLVIGVVLVVVFAALIPLPDFEELRPGVLDGRVAFVTDADDCVSVADLERVLVTELSCEYPFPEQLGWSRHGVEVTVFGGASQPIRVTLDAVDGSVIASEPVDEFPPREPDPAFVRRDRDRGSSIVGPDGSSLLALEGPETYYIEAVSTHPDGEWIAFVDSAGRLAVFEIGSDAAKLVADGVRSYPSPVWEP